MNFELEKKNQQKYFPKKIVVEIHKNPEKSLYSWRIQKKDIFRMFLDFTEGISRLGINPNPESRGKTRTEYHEGKNFHDLKEYIRKIWEI